jgi:hypothetical protein
MVLKNRGNKPILNSAQPGDRTIHKTQAGHPIIAGAS